ncbi:S1 family peptidase [Jannaschia marina]|uniref:S1 family peptidase n=1 Tax=Jannaschia marina TaxID=2741674 RepID=UPI0015CAD937|nr:serine protease [Jannaschia marina]
MFRVLVAFAFLVIGLPARADVSQSFDPALLTREDVRFLQAAMAFDGTYVGRIDGVWGDYSARALAPARGGNATAGDALETLGPFIADFETAGWRAFTPDEATAIILPSKRLVFDEGEDFLEWHEPDRSLVIRYVFRGGPGSGAMHDWLRDEHVGPEPFYRTETAEAFISRGRIDSGQDVYLRTTGRGHVFETVVVQWEPRQAARARVVVASLSNGSQRDLVLPSYGFFASLIARDPPEPEAPRVTTTSEPRIVSSGTGFYIGPGDVVTAAHVVAGCSRLTLEDGTPLTPIASDTGLDLAVLGSGARSPDWIEIAGDIPVRLGAGVTAIGFPYRALLDQGMTVTRGNVSALRGLYGEDERLMLSAPVQPGNSGGPLLDAKGRVVGVVVARVSDEFIQSRSGSIPQNMNVATRHNALLRFLRDAGVSPRPPLGRKLTLSDGVPPVLTRATVLIRCHR